MNTQNFSAKLSTAIALVAIASTVTIWEVRRVHAQPPPDGERLFGMLGITRGQTLRLNVVNLSPSPDPLSPPDPCRVVLTFRDANGRPFTDEKGNVIRRAVELQTGQSAFLDLNGDVFAGPSGDTTGAVRLQLRPFVRVQSEPSADQTPPDPCRTTAEVFDNTTAKTSFVMYSANHNETLVRDRSR